MYVPFAASPVKDKFERIQHQLDTCYMLDPGILDA